MHFVFKSRIAAAMAAAISVAGVRPAHADIIVTAGVNNQGTDNVLLTDATNVDIVTGTLNSGLFDVYFQSAGGKLSADANGQAVVTPGTNNKPFTDVSFYIDDATFTRAVFNLNSETDGSVRPSVTGINIDSGLFTLNLQVDDSGQNFFTIDAVNGQRIRSIDLLALGVVDLEDLRQVRIGGGARDVAVPEPVSMVLFGAGWVALAAARRRRRA